LIKNRQEIINNYKEYGYTDEEISSELEIPVALVKEATTKKRRFVAERFSNYGANSVIRPYFELLFEHGPKKINEVFKEHGFVKAAKILGVGHDTDILLKLKIHYNYLKPIPHDALITTQYVPEALRVDIDARDGKICQICGKPTTENSIRYHKIRRYGRVTVDNVITLCNQCRSYRRSRGYSQRLNYTKFKEKYERAPKKT
jgi:hypothetical protein